MAAGLLSDLKVIELGEMVSAAFCGKLLAELGAEVIKVEKPLTGDKARQRGPFPDDIPHPEKSGLFLYLNTNKRGITLDVATVTGRKLFKELLKQADILIENNSPSVMKQLGLDYPNLEEENPQLIVTSLTPFGQTGPYRDYKGYDINLTAAGGISEGIGEPDRKPLTPPLLQTGYQAGLCGAIASLVAVQARSRIHRGQHIDLSGAECWATLHTGHSILMYIYQWRITRRTGYHASDFPYPNCILPCKDGYIFIGAVEGHQWRKLLELMGNPEWANDPRFKDRTEINNLYADEVDSLIIPWLSQFTKEELFSLAREHLLPFGPVKDIGEVVNDAHLKARNFFVDIDHPQAGVLKYPGFPGKFSKTPCNLKHPAPLLGEHNYDIYYQRLGYSKEELVKLHRERVI